MALGNMLAGIGGFTEGWKAMDELIKSHQSMLAKAEEIEGYTKGKELADAQAKVKEAMALDPTFGVDPDAPKGTTGSSTPSSSIALPEYSARYSGAKPSEEITGLITKAAEQYKVDPVVLTGLLSVESSFNPKAVSPAGAQGIAQLMPGTATGLGVKDPFDPAQAIPAAAKYLRQGLDAHGGDLNRALMYYHGGPDTRQWGPITRAYPGAVLGRAKQLGAGPDPSAYPASTPAPTAPSAVPAAPPAPPSASGGGDFPGATSAVTAPPAPPSRAPMTAQQMYGGVPTTPPAAAARSVAEAPIPPPTAAPALQKGLTPEQYRQQYGQGYPPGALEGRPPPRGGSGGGTPQMPGPGAGGNPYNTQLSPAQEAAFRAWVKNNKVKFNPDQDMTDYDMRGFWAAQQQGDTRAQTQYNPDANEVHYPDIWKTPIHKTFSNDSQYAPPGAPRWVGGRLISQDGTVLVDETAGNALGR